MKRAGAAGDMGKGEQGDGIMIDPTNTKVCITDNVDFLIVTSFKRLCIFEFKFIYFIITSG